MKSSLLSSLILRLRERFPTLNFAGGSPPESVLIIPAKHPDVGDIEVHNDGNELTLYLGKFTHVHESCLEAGLSDDQKAEVVVNKTLSFLEAIFDGQVVLWGNLKGTGGCFRIGHERSEFVQDSGSLYVWSGPYGAAELER